MGPTPIPRILPPKESKDERFRRQITPQPDPIWRRALTLGILMLAAIALALALAWWITT